MDEEDSEDPIIEEVDPNDRFDNHPEMSDDVSEDQEFAKFLEEGEDLTKLGKSVAHKKGPSTEYSEPSNVIGVKVSTQERKEVGVSDMFNYVNSLKSSQKNYIRN